MTDPGMRDGSYQAAGVYVKVQALLEEARAEGFNSPSIAYALLSGARDVMQDNTAFLRELERFKAHWNMS